MSARTVQLEHDRNASSQFKVDDFIRSELLKVHDDGAVGVAMRDDEHVLTSEDLGQDLFLEVRQRALSSELCDRQASQKKSDFEEKKNTAHTSKLSPSGGGTSKERLQMCTCSSPN